jgi:hypothetical protein
MVLFFVYLTIYKKYFSFPSSYLVSIKRVLLLELKYALTKENFTGFKNPNKES